MIEVKNLTKIYPNGTHGLDDVNVDIQNGEFVCVIGLSGAGKSTFLRCLNRLNTATSGQILIDGQDIAFAEGAKLRTIRRRIGFVFQQFNLSTRLTALENVLAGRLGYHNRFVGALGLYPQADIELAQSALNRVGLGDKFNVRVDELSGGQQQRVAIARAVAQQPTLILADEPMASLDPKLSNVIMGLLSAIVDNIPIMYAVLQMAPTMDHGQWLLITLACGVGGSLLSVGSAAGVALMGVSKGQYTFFGHLKWAWAIALGYIASILVHLWVNAHFFGSA